MLFLADDLGREPFVVDVDMRHHNEEEIGEALFKCFEEALRWLPSPDDVLVTWDLSIGPALDHLFNHIVAYCKDQKIPIPVHTGMKKYNEKGLGNAIDFLGKRSHDTAKCKYLIQICYSRFSCEA